MKMTELSVTMYLNTNNQGYALSKAVHLANDKGEKDEKVFYWRSLRGGNSGYSRCLSAGCCR
jgi:hypothetical protein